MEKEHVVHTIAPVYDQYSKILILGSFPSVKSREAQFFYGHPQNRFWKVISGVLGCSLPVTVEEKRQMLLSHGIAVWDVIASCEITGSSDSSIEQVVPNDIGKILRDASIRSIYTNGGKAYELYRKFCQETVEREAIKVSLHQSGQCLLQPASPDGMLEVYKRSVKMRGNI